MVVEKKVHRQQQHFHVTVYITEMWPKKKRLVIKQPKTRPLVFHCIVGAHKDKSMRDSLCVLPRDGKERMPPQYCTYPLVPSSRPTESENGCCGVEHRAEISVFQFIGDERLRVWQVHLSIASSGATKVALNTVHRVIGVTGSHRANKEEEHKSGSTEDDKLALRRAVVAILSPGTAGGGSVLAHLVAAKLVPDKTHQSNGVAEKLEASNGSLPEEHGSSDQQDILQDTTQSHDQGRGLANLYCVLIMLSLGLRSGILKYHLPGKRPRR